jgi:GAF domain-containing protein
MIKSELDGLSKAQKLVNMVRLIKKQSESESDPLALLCNATGIMNQYLEDINWVGFYLMRNGELVLGPFQGKAACTRIKVGQGVCGTSVSKRQTIIVEDVDAFPGHIPCDSASRSEVVVPVIYKDDVIAVIDCDSPLLNRFSKMEGQALEEVAEFLAETVYFFLT